jgi:hypothetical protein
MSKESSVTKQSRAHGAVKGLRKLLKPGDTVPIGGVAYSREEIIAAFERHEVALALKRTRYAEYRSAVAQERELARMTNMLWVGLHRWADAVRGRDGLVALGMRAYKKTGPKTVEAKLAGVRKRAKKRASK